MPPKSPFAERLERLMADRNLTQSDLARVVWGTMTDERGYEVARNRQILGKYLKGTLEPRDRTKRTIADALGVPLSDLSPGSYPAERPKSGISLEDIDQVRTRIEINLLVPRDVAREVMTILLPHWV